jgi:hypothetical protein
LGSGFPLVRHLLLVTADDVEDKPAEGEWTYLGDVRPHELRVWLVPALLDELLALVRLRFGLCRGS